MKVFIVIQNYYFDRETYGSHILSVFDTRVKAEAFILTQPDDDGSCCEPYQFEYEVEEKEVK